MAIETREILRTFFETGDIPTQNQFYDFLDSYVHKLDDGVTVYQVPGTTEKKFGIGTKLPGSRLGIKTFGSQETVISLHRTDIDNASWFVSLNPTIQDRPGFSIDQVLVSGAQSRFYIQDADGNIGIGTTQPSQQLHLERSTPSGLTGIKIINTANTADQGWILGQVQDGTTELDGAFSIFENSVVAGSQKLTILSGGNVGINEPNPNTTFHVSKSLIDPKTDLDLITGTGIVVIGPITNNVVGDYRGFQARKGEFDGTNLVLTADTFNLQRLGGDILIHGDSTVTASSKGIITNDSRLGLGTITPVEKVEINGAIKIGTTANTNDGTIRFTGSDFEGYIGAAWVSLTAGNGPWAYGTGCICYDANPASRVAIGTDTTSASLEIYKPLSVTEGSTATIIHNLSSTNSSVQDDNRVGMEIKCTGTWGGDPLSKDIGLYVSAIEGQDPATNNNFNIAAILNGNVVIGNNVAGSKLFGTAASNVLSIQNGIAPTDVADVNSIQMYVVNTGAVGVVPFPAINIKNGDGDLIKLYRETGLEAANMSPVDDSYGIPERDVIINLRTRLNALEQKLISIGILANPI